MAPTQNCQSIIADRHSNRHKILCWPLATEFQSRAGHFYIYDASTNAIYRKSSSINPVSRASPIVKIGLPYSFGERCRTLESELSYLILNVTEQCNLRCDYCTYSGHHLHRRTHTSKKMSWAIARRAVDWFAYRSRHSATLSFYGGEPLINFELIKRTVQYARGVFTGKKIRFHIATNGTLLDRRIQLWLVDNPDVLVTVTLNGPATLHDRFRHTEKGRGSYERIMQNLSVFKQENPITFNRQIDVIINYFNVAELPTIKAWYLGETLFNQKLPLSLRRISLCFADAELRSQFTKHLESNAIPVLDKIENEYLSCLKSKQYQKNFWGVLWDSPLSRLHFRPMTTVSLRYPFTGGCAPLTKRLFVDTDGNLRLCEKADGKIKIGSIDDGIDFYRLNQLKFERLLNAKCRNCWALRMCSLCLKFPRCADVQKSLHRHMALFCTIHEMGAHLLSHLIPPKGQRNQAC